MIPVLKQERSQKFFQGGGEGIFINNFGIFFFGEGLFWFFLKNQSDRSLMMSNILGEGVWSCLLPKYKWIFFVLNFVTRGERGLKIQFFDVISEWPPSKLKKIFHWERRIVTQFTPWLRIYSLAINIPSPTIS